MKKFSFIFFSLVNFWVLVFAQKTTIIFRYHADSLQKDSFYLSIKKPFDLRSFGEDYHYQEKIISVKHQNGFIETTCQYVIPNLSCGYLSSGFGYKTFIIPGDSMFVNINSSPKPAIKLNGKYSRPWFEDLTIKGKNNFVYALFDSLAIKYGALGWSSSLTYKITANLGDFCALAGENYSVRLKYLDNYVKEHNIPNIYKHLAQSEIYASYINDLLKPLAKGVSLKAYPEKHKMALLTANFNDPELYFKTSDYSSTAYSYTSAISREKSKGKSFSNDDFIEIYNLIKKTYTDTIKNHLLTQHLSCFLGNPQLIYPSFDSLLNDYKSFCHNRLFKNFIDSSYAVKKNEIFRKYNIDDAMLSPLLIYSNRSIAIKDLLKARPVLIICWASWCLPCIKEVPSEKKLQNQYKNKIDFVYLSFDKDKSAWEDKARSLNITGNNYLLLNYFKSDLAHFYQITSLPFYLLYDKKGQLVETNGLRPSDPKFKEILDKLNN
ncbi:TlpA family protein disulfide reductase [Mucilaginibacter sp. RB4R14]|uniref:TlpA family protein disulfide reductase n=1 Tax=Mucilaginibacter aurantiaciroseus TaxID=2949308 RepID=UPI002091091B|nr:TlpA disulfide reductase family protein [Mucilaginibacter aurantiaciroseus]MCO5936922.1 TlpA family protein disulfide reductase [Mucilaginibacter aurantiaciroseus]